MIAPATALARVPADLDAVEAAPLMCAGITTFNALRNSGARPGEVVAVLGLGGLGHLGVQFAAKLGFKTVAIARGQDKEPLARQLGAHHYIDSRAQDPAAALRELGGAKVVLATVTSGSAMTAVLGGLAPRGTLMIIGVTEPLTIDPVPLILGSKSVRGWYSGTSIELAGDACVQRALGRSADDRDLPAGACRRCLRSHDERRSALPGRADDRQLNERLLRRVQSR